MPKVSISRKDLRAVSLLCKRMKDGESRLMTRDGWLGTHHAAMRPPSLSVISDDTFRTHGPSSEECSRILSLLPDQDEFVLPVDNLPDFNAYTNGPSVTFDPNDLSFVAIPALAALKHKDARDYLHGINCTGGYLEATDGHTLHRMPSPFGDMLDGFRIPAQLLKAAGKHVATIHFSLHHNSYEARIVTNKQYLRAAMRDAVFPDTGRVIPDIDPEDHVVPVTPDLIAALDRLLARKDTYRYGSRTSTVGRFAVADNRILSISVTLENGPEPHIEWLDELTEPVLMIGFNMRILRAALGCDATIRLTDASGPARIDHPDGKLAVIMPMRP